MNIYGYHRTSTSSQNLDRGIHEIEKFCNMQSLNLIKVFCDQSTGTNFIRSRYIVLKEDVLRPGDTLIITEIDRLGRNKKETLKELQHFKDNNIRIMILELPTTLIDFSSIGNEMSTLILEAINNMLIEMYATIAQAETEKRSKRQREGIEAMKKRGEWNKYGRPHVMDLNDFKKEYKKIEKGEIRPFELMKKLNVKKSTYYHYVQKIKEQNHNI